MQNQEHGAVGAVFRKNGSFKLNPQDKKSPMVTPSWEESEKYVKEALKWAAVIEGLCRDITTATQKMYDAWFEAYKRAPLIDCSFGDSPIGPVKQRYHIRAFLKKLGWTCVSAQDVIKPIVMIPDLSVVMKEVSAWVLKGKKIEKAD